MNRWITWLTAGALTFVGVGAVVVSTVDIGDTQAATTGYLTQLAEQTDVTRDSAATGTVATAASYALAFGIDPQLADSASAATSSSSWTVADVAVAVGDRVAAGQKLASADTSDIESQIAETQASLDLAQLSLAQAKEALASARTDTDQQLVDAKAAVETAQISLRSAKAQKTAATDAATLRQARLAVIAARGQLRTARRQRDALRADLKGGYPDQTIAVGQAQASLDSLRSQLADEQAQLERANIIAPIDGVVSAVNIMPGMVAPGASDIVLDSTTLEVVADVVESDISSLAVGQPAVVTISALDLQAPGTVTSIAATTSASSSSVVTFPVTVTLTDPDERIKPGMSSDVKITTASADNVVAVPVAALSGRNGNYVVRVQAADGSIETRPVTVGLVTETLAEVQSGLSAGESVVVGTSTDRNSTSNSTSNDQGGFVTRGAFDLGGGGFPGGFARGARQ
jgi:multidrug efflux pump subunit AcrA (membrane-fusion protein)